MHGFSRKNVNDLIELMLIVRERMDVGADEEVGVLRVHFEPVITASDNRAWLGVDQSGIVHPPYWVKKKFKKHADTQLGMYRALVKDDGTRILQRHKGTEWLTVMPAEEWLDWVCQLDVDPKRMRKTKGIAPRAMKEIVSSGLFMCCL